jgi:putative transposase
MDQKAEFALKALETENFRQLCREYGISAKTGYKWKERFLREGMAGMGEQSRRPLASPGELGEVVACEIVRLKQRHPHWGPLKLQEIYRRQHGSAPSLSSFKRVLEKAGMVEKRRLRRASEGGRLHTDRRAEGPGEIWTVDFKGWWYDAEGRRCEPLTVRDEFSRYVLESRRVEHADTETVWARFAGLFERHGLPEAIRSDNGPPFATRSGILGLSQLSARWVALGIGLERSRPACPQDNGGHERLHRDMSVELEGKAVGSCQAGLDVWREEFNNERPHQALGMKTPAEVYKKSPRRYAGLPADLEYSGMHTRKIAKRGTLAWEGEQIFISEAVSGWSVGLAAREDGRWDVHFARLLLGQIEPKTSSFQRAASGPLEAGAKQNQDGD